MVWQRQNKWKIDYLLKRNTESKYFQTSEMSPELASPIKSRTYTEGISLALAWLVKWPKSVSSLFAENKKWQLGFSCCSVLRRILRPSEGALWLINDGTESRTDVLVSLFTSLRFLYLMQFQGKLWLSEIQLWFLFLKKIAIAWPDIFLNSRKKKISSFTLDLNLSSTGYFSLRKDFRLWNVTRFPMREKQAHKKWIIFQRWQNPLMPLAYVFAFHRKAITTCPLVICFNLKINKTCWSRNWKQGGQRVNSIANTLFSHCTWFPWGI